MKSLTNKLKGIKDDFVVFIQLRKIDDSVHSDAIEAKFGISGPEVRCLINYLSNAGYPIGNTIRVSETKTIKAYFWAKNWDELFPTIQDLRSRANEDLERARNLEKIYSNDTEEKFL